MYEYFTSICVYMHDFPETPIAGEGNQVFWSLNNEWLWMICRCMEQELCPLHEKQVFLIPENLSPVLRRVSYLKELRDRMELLILFLLLSTTSLMIIINNLRQQANVLGDGNSCSAWAKILVRKIASELLVNNWVYPTETNIVTLSEIFTTIQC